MRIGELARRAGVHVETLRYYERRGLLPEPPRGPSGHRAYGEDAVRFVRSIKEAQGLGFTLREIEEYLRLVGGSPADPSHAMRFRMAAKIGEIDEKIASLRRVRAGLSRVLGCACDSLDRCTCGAAFLARRGRDPELRAGDVLHVTNGDSAANTLRRTGLGGAVLAWQDALNEGPVPAGARRVVREARARFLSECGWGGRREIAAELERRDELLTAALADGRQVVLWFEHDLYDQLQLLQILALAAETGYERERLEVIQVGSFPGRPDFHGLGELDEAELVSLWPARVGVRDEVVELGVRAWDAFRAPEPTGLVEIVHGETSPLPFLAAALARLLEELPDASTGLSRGERQLLETFLDRPRAPGEAFLAAIAREEAPFEGDAWVWRRLAELARGDRPLLAPVGGGDAPEPPPAGDPHAFAATRFALTDDGRAVLAGEADRVELLDVDRWLGGTHLVHGAVWRWDRDARRLHGPA